jgi:hypothetical protein
MANFDRDDVQRPGYGSGLRDGGNTPVLIGAAVVLVLLVGAVWYSFKGGAMNTSPAPAPMHQTTTTTPPAPAPASPAEPAAPKP